MLLVVGERLVVAVEVLTLQVLAPTGLLAHNHCSPVQVGSEPRVSQQVGRISRSTLKAGAIEGARVRSQLKAVTVPKSQFEKAASAPPSSQ
jgi:hypothetical protein